MKKIINKIVLLIKAFFNVNHDDTIYDDIISAGLAAQKSRADLRKAQKFNEDLLAAQKYSFKEMEVIFKKHYPELFPNKSINNS